MTCSLAELLRCGIFICCFTASLTIRELMPEVEYLKVNYNCVDEQTTETVRDSFIVPFESGIRLKCGNICTKERDSLELKYLWLFQPSNELKVIYLPGNQTNSYTVTDDGSLEIDQIPGNGVFHCKHKNTIHAVYSITVVDTKTIKPELKTYIVDDFTNQEVSLPDSFFGRLTLVEKFQTSCSTFGKVGIKRSIYQYEIRLGNYSFDNIQDSVDFKIQEFQTINVFDFEITQSEVMRSVLSKLKLPKPALYLYEYCTEKRPRDTKNNAEKFAYQQYLARSQVFKTKFKNLGKSVVFSCAFKGVKEYRWKKISLDGKRSQWLSALYLQTNTADRMRIDFLNNLCIDKLQMDDYKYRYVCYDDDKPVVSFVLKLNVALTSAFFLDLLPQPDVLTIICVALSAAFIFWTILSSPDISAKL